MSTCYFYSNFFSLTSNDHHIKRDSKSLLFAKFFYSQVISVFEQGPFVCQVLTFEVEDIRMIDGKRNLWNTLMVPEVDGFLSVSMSKALLAITALLLFLCFSVFPAGAMETKPLTLLYFGCQDGYLKPCG
jgi:hypothetical protein